MLLPLLSTALALTVPVSAILSDEVHNGGTEGFRQSVTGTVAVSDPATGAVYTVGTEELTVNKREASGSGAFSFAGEPAGSIRTWEVYYLDANGRLLGDPQEVDILFDAEGNGAIAARNRGNNDIMSILIRRGREVGIKVQGAAVDAALIGVIELSNDGAGNDLETDADLELLDATTYAAFLELGLDAVVAIDSYKTTLQGNITIRDIPVAGDGTVAGGAELRWDVTIYDPTVTSCPLRVCDIATPLPIASVSYLENIGAVKRKTGQPPAVKLQPVDVTYDSWDTTMSLRVDGDLRDMEISASLDVEGMRGSDILVAEPGWIGVEPWEDISCADGYEACSLDGGAVHCCAQLAVDIFQDGDCEECGDYDFVDPTDPPSWVFLADEVFEVEVLDSAGGFVANHFCTMKPTARTLEGTAGTDTLVGECTGGAATEVRRIKVEVLKGSPTERVHFDLELGGSAFTAERTGGLCSRTGGCSEETVSVLGGTLRIWNDGMLVREPVPMTVTEAEFQLPFAFASDISGMTGDLEIVFDDPTYDLTWVTYEDGIRGYMGDRLMRDIGFADVDVVRNQKEYRCENFTAGMEVLAAVLLSDCAFAGYY